MLGHLRVFDTFCRSGSVTRAAAMLHVTPGAVSQQLKQLENMLGIRLFNKSGRLLEPAPLAKVLAARLAELFDRIENALVDAAAVSRKKRLRIVVSPDFATKWLMPKLTAFLVALPDVDLDIATSARMEDHRLDNADFTTRNGNGQRDDVRADLVFDDVLVPVCAPEIAETIKSPGTSCNTAGSTPCAVRMPGRSGPTLPAFLAKRPSDRWNSPTWGCALKPPRQAWASRSPSAPIWTTTWPMAEWSLATSPPTPASACI